MLKKSLALGICLLAASNVYALDSDKFNKALDTYANALSQTSYYGEECQATGNYELYENALNRADSTANLLVTMINKISSQTEIDATANLIDQFAKASDLNKEAAKEAKKMLKVRATYLANTENNDGAISLSVSRAQAPAAKPAMRAHQKRLITIETPEAEAVIVLEDTSKNRRVNNLEQILKRHGCKLLASYQNEGKNDDKYCYYFSGRKYVIDALLCHYTGSIVDSDLKAIVKITTGGFWGGKKNHVFTVAPKRSNKNIMGELGWYKSVIQHDPIKYFSENAYEELTTVASKEKVAGVDKLLFKNAKVEIWVAASNNTENEAIYHEKLELGDIYIDAK